MRRLEESSASTASLGENQMPPENYSFARFPTIHMPTISSPCKPTTSPPIIFGNIFSGKVTAKNILAIEQQDEEKHFLRNEIYLFHTLETMFRTKDPSQTSISSSLPLISAFFLFNLSQTPEPALVIVTAGPGPIGNCTTLGGKTTK